jgi:hypothetical protein
MTKLSKPNDDPALATCVIWQADCDRMIEAVRFASARESELFGATDDARAEAERLYLAAAKVRDRQIDELEILTRAVFKLKAQSFEGAAAKLAVAIRSEAPSLTDPNPPWPYLRSVGADLDRLVAALKANTANDQEQGSQE